MHRPRVYPMHLEGSMFRPPGLYWRFECDCGYEPPYWMVMTRLVALKFANTHVWATRSWEQRIDDEVAKFRQQLDAR